jgi:hypothetical protein
MVEVPEVAYQLTGRTRQFTEVQTHQQRAMEIAMPE